MSSLLPPHPPTSSSSPAPLHRQIEGVAKERLGGGADEACSLATSGATQPGLAPPPAAATAVTQCAPSPLLHQRSSDLVASPVSAAIVRHQPPPAQVVVLPPHGAPGCPISGHKRCRAVSDIGRRCRRVFLRAGVCQGEGCPQDAVATMGALRPRSRFPNAVTSPTTSSSSMFNKSTGAAPVVATGPAWGVLRLDEPPVPLSTQVAFSTFDSADGSSPSFEDYSHTPEIRFYIAVEVITRLDIAARSRSLSVEEYSLIEFLKEQMASLQEILGIQDVPVSRVTKPLPIPDLSIAAVAQTTPPKVTTIEGKLVPSVVSSVVSLEDSVQVVAHHKSNPFDKFEIQQTCAVKDDISDRNSNFPFDGGRSLVARSAGGVPTMEWCAAYARRRGRPATKGH